MTTTTPTQRHTTALPINELSDPAEVATFFRFTVALTETELARALGGADARSVRRWTTTGSAPQARYAERLDDLRDIATVLEESLAPESIGRWLRARSRTLAGRRPIDVLADDDDAYEQVRRAAVGFATGDPT